MVNDDFADAERLVAAVSSLPPADMERVARLLELYAEATPAAQQFVSALLAKARATDGIEEIRARQKLIVAYLEDRAGVGGPA
jgi:hypothetical protein